MEMEKYVQELQQIIPFKDSIDRGDIVLIVAKQPPMLVYALVKSILRDMTRKDEWWHVGMTLLTVPPQEITWTLRTAQMTGQEIFTMGGEERFVKAVEFGTVPNSAGAGEKSKARGPVLKRVK